MQPSSSPPCTRCVRYHSSAGRSEGTSSLMSRRRDSPTISRNSCNSNARLIFAINRIPAVRLRFEKTKAVAVRRRSSIQSS